jgi:tetratricopeptide (TPR) repeat protein
VNHHIARPRGLHLDVYRWETDSYPGFHPQGPQGLIDPILKIETCDILIGIFWRRFGTPVSDAKSGTEHEFRIAYEAWKKNRKPQIMVYFSQRKYFLESRDETHQAGLVLQFKREFPHEGLWWDYKNKAEFEQLTRNHLSQLLSSPFPNGETDRTDDGRRTTVDWGALDQKLLREYLSMCALHDDSYQDLISDLAKDQHLVKQHFDKRGLAMPSPAGVMCLSQAGVLLCCQRNHIPHKDLHVHVKFQNKAHPDELTEELEGSVMLLYAELFKRLNELSRRRMGSANIRSASGAEAVFYDYPPTAIVEALMNFLIHRDYHSDDIGFITIYLDRLEFVNPGKSLLPVQEMLAAENDIRPLYKRNPRLIEAMHKTRLNQRAGSGLRRIISELENNGSRKPDGSPGLDIENDEEKNRFTLTIFRRHALDERTATHEPPALTPLFQLPPPPADFTGRTTELAELRAAIEKGGVHISGLQGQGGVGKTALALKLAAELAPNFPDAQIYLDLKGVSENPLTAAEAMSHVLRTFHPEVRLPEKEDELHAQYLSVLYGKRALLLMDDAKDAAQIKRLIPPAGCALLVTSRRHFTLPGLQAKNLDTLPPPDAKDLLLRIAPRIGGEAGALAKLCGYLPQALRLAASAIAARINLDPQEYAKQLADEKKRLGLLASDDESVMASITLSYNLLDAEIQKRWRTLAVFPDTFDSLATAAVWEIEADATQDTLNRLLQFSMLEWDDATRRYRLHELMRDFGRQRSSASESGAAFRSHARYYLTVARRSDELYEKGGDSIMRGLALLDLEWPNIQAGQAWAAAHSSHDGDAAKLASGYPDGGTHILLLRQHPREQTRWRKAALDAARQLNDRAAEGRHLGNLGLAYDSLGDYRRAIEHHEHQLAITREIGDRRGEANALGNLGIAYDATGDYHRAIEYHEQRLAIAHEIGDRRGEGQSLGNLGSAYYRLGNYRRAIEYYEQRLPIARETGDRRGEGSALSGLGIAYYSLGENRRAIEYHEQQLDIARQIGDRRAEGNASWNMSLALDNLGERKKAIEQAESALKIFEEIESPSAAKVKKQLDIWRNS